MQETRRKILDRLVAHPPSTSADLARALDLSQANIRYHLRKLIDQGYVIIVGQLDLPQRGRPTLLYTSTLRAVEGDLTPLVLSLWDELLPLKPGVQRQRRFQNLARRFIEKNQPAPIQGHMASNLHQAVQALNELGFRSRWEAHAESPRVILEHCPFDSTIESLPEICQLDACILEEILGLPVEQISQRRLTSGRGSACSFRLRAIHSP